MHPGALTADGVWKSFPRWDAHARTLHGFLSRRIPALMRGAERTWVLRDLSFTVEPGASLGLIGANGAGKSTLLRLAAGLGSPTRGRIIRPVSTAAVLSLGETFDLSLTGRENAMTAAIVAGMRRSEARARMPAILEFADLEAFADAPVRTYSSGMILRLAFGVVAQLRPSALVLDEVLAVGDLGFQARCCEHIAQLREQGACLLFASHDLPTVVEQCDQAVWLQSGSVRAAGSAADVVAAYESAFASDTLTLTPKPAVEHEGSALLELRRNRFGTQELTIERVSITDARGAAVRDIVGGQSLTVSLELCCHGRPVEPVVGISLHRSLDGVVCFDTTTEIEGVRVGPVADRRSLSLTLERVDLSPGTYGIDVGVYDRRWAHAYDHHRDAYEIRVLGREGDHGIVRPPHRWRLDPGD